MQPVDPAKYRHIVFFTGAGMSAESGVPTYRGRGGIWSRYRWEEYACQEAFDADPERVLKFHELRRAAVLSCNPHAGHHAIAMLEKKHPRVTVVTQNIDGIPAGGQPECGRTAREPLAASMPLQGRLGGHRREIWELHMRQMRGLAAA